MRLQRIYSSKLYVTSTRKDRIHAAIQDPINAELVQQLADYLDEDSKVLLEQAEQKQDQETETSDSANSVAPADTPDTSTSGMPNHSGGGASSFTGDILKDFGEDESSDVDSTPEDTGDSDAPVATEVEESTKVEGKPITATTVLWTTMDDVISDFETIKGTLNVKEDTNGVTRLNVADSELWIYFHDDVNLNDKMVEVINTLNAAGYTYLKFNRLARSNNAIVFDIGLDPNAPMKSEEELSEEVK